LSQVMEAARVNRQPADDNVRNAVLVEVSTQTRRPRLLRLVVPKIVYQALRHSPLHCLHPFSSGKCKVESAKYRVSPFHFALSTLHFQLRSRMDCHRSEG